MGFHADQEAVRVLGKAINFARLGMAALAGQEATLTAARIVDAPPQAVTPE